MGGGVFDGLHRLRVGVGNWRCWREDTGFGGRREGQGGWAAGDMARWGLVRATGNLSLSLEAACEGRARAFSKAVCPQRLKKIVGSLGNEGGGWAWAQERARRGIPAS